MIKVITSLFPRGSAWFAAVGEDLDIFYQSIADIYEQIRDDLAQIRYMLDPEKTPWLEELENEYGEITDTTIPEDERRTTLIPIRYKKRQQSSEDTIESRLIMAGFTNAQVWQNDPAVDPRPLGLERALVYAGDGNAYAGDPDAVCGLFGGILLVNGNLSQLVPDYGTVAGNGNAYAGQENAVAGYFEGYLYAPFDYEIPDDPDCWPAVFFVGGDVTRDGTGAIINVETINISAKLKAKFERYLMKLKPLHSWCILFVNYV